MSEDYCVEDVDETKPKRTPQQQQIADLMYKEGKSYAEAYDLVINPKKEEKKDNDWYDPQTPVPQPQVLEPIKDDLAAHGKEIFDLKADVQLNNEIADRLVFQQAKEFKRQTKKLTEIAHNLEAKINTVKVEKETFEKELWTQLEAVRKKLLELDEKRAEFSAEKAELTKKKKGYTKLISKSAEKEFAEE